VPAPRHINATHHFDLSTALRLASVAELVCFRGTEADRPEDWITNLDFDLVDGPFGGRTHEGFYGALSCVWHLLDKEVGRLQCHRNDA